MSLYVRETSKFSERSIYNTPSVFCQNITNFVYKQIVRLRKPYMPNGIFKYSIELSEVTRIYCSLKITKWTKS